MTTPRRGDCVSRHLCGLSCLQRAADWPTTLAIQAQYGEDAGSIAAYIANPEKKRPDFPTMPPQDHLSEPMRQLVAEYMLALTN
ncbi:MAG: hypothetical protein CM15mP103_02100 [Gammaproteobacteria bacterium]|nr:MAG: hypothetical protein CM15mP103_02100 [Gammaproteobacteria bacterium]